MLPTRPAEDGFRQTYEWYLGSDRATREPDFSLDDRLLAVVV